MRALSLPVSWGEGADAPSRACVRVVVWDSYGQDGDITGVFGQRYGRILPVELMGFRVE